MKACILTIGTEILFGQIVNTNATYLSKELNNIGIDVLYNYTVGDNKKRILNQLETAFKDCDIIITSGGLGPTEDDITREVISEFANKPLEKNIKAIENIKYIFKMRNYSMPNSNLKQGFLPKGATALYNDNGTAPGFILKLENNKFIIALPGPPRELIPMFDTRVREFLLKIVDYRICYKFIRTIGIGESLLEEKINHLLINKDGVTVAPYANLGEAYLRVTAKDRTYELAELKVDRYISKINNIVSEYVYSLDGRVLSKVVFDIIVKRSLNISSCESCTGGMFAQEFTSYNGASKVFDRGIVTYSNKSKIEELGVKKDIIETYGAVSKETAVAMVEGLYKKTLSNICISVTGIAGPKGCTENKPVGLVYIAIMYEGKIYCYQYNFKGNRDSIRKLTVLNMFKHIHYLLEERIDG